MSQHKIEKLAEFLVDMGLENEAHELLGLFQKEAIAKQPDILDWYEVIDEVNAPYNDTGYAALSKYLNNASAYLKNASEGLMNATPEDIKNITDVIPLETLISKASQRKNFLKYSADKDGDIIAGLIDFCVNENLIARPNYKQANWWKHLKMIGGNSARYVLPFVSLIFAAINFYYCAVEFSKLMTEIPEAGLSWYEPLQPGKLLQAAQNNQDDPDLLKKIVKATKTSKVFVDEFISLIANSIDGIKDIIFFLANLLTGGLTLAIDLGISFLIMCVEWAAEGATLHLYDKVITFIREVAASKIRDFHLFEFDEKIKGLEDLPDI